MADSDINFDWNEPVLGEDNEGNPIELFPIDTLHRGKYAKFLYDYLADNSSNNGYVLNLNAQWGAGKTYFINRWMDSIKEKHPVVYVDAWKQDYSDDPMLTVISSIVTALEVHLPDGNQKAIALKNKASRFFKAAAPLLAKGLIKKATGMNIDEIGPKDDNKSLNTDLYNLSGEAGAALAKCLVDDHNEKLKTVEYLRSDIKSLIEAIDPKKNLKTPAFVFIDELDRCRPSYAVEMLEVIKHFFELENIVFVVATDTEQLQHAVKALYGEGFDAQTYLGRFFRRRYSLPVSKSRYEFVKNMIGESYVVKPSWNNYVPAISEGGNLWNLISIVAGRFNLSLRETEQLADKFLAALSSAEQAMNPYLLLTLFALRDKHYSVYESWTADFFDPSKLKDVMKSAGLDKMSLPLHRGNSGDFVAIEGTEVVNFDLYEMLLCMHNFSTFKSYSEKRAEERALRASFNLGERDTYEKDYILLSFLELATKKSDYIHWVEYAVSFDE
ncbi:KAP family P-loop NTPase fold protein [Vibrio gigantis]|uniref:KAP family P-loop NTPase fold protein n=1 Tax=Vibrio gigantis TaxID=296199 RepID=UPI001BFE8418|nr:KAP family NTPase [Vibrio gigantis]